jgi:uncharacterized protein (DUF1015 family)
VARVLPFRGYRYNVEKIGDPSAVVSPPYDVISDDFRHELHLRHPHNVIRLILGEDRTGDGTSENRYLRARRYFEEWEKTEILFRDPHPGFYVYRQEYPWKGGQRRVRTGLIGVVGLEEYSAGVIFPHERTLPGPKADRLQLLQTLPVNLEQIFCFYPGPPQPIRGLLERALQDPPLYDFWEGEDIRHRLWALQEAATVAEIHNAFRDRQLIVADGHHRYETALTFRKEMLKTDRSPSPIKAYNYVMMTLVSAEDEGLTVLPTHRLVTPPRHQRPAEILQAIQPYFHLERRTIASTESGLRKCLQEMEDRGSNGHVIGLYVGGAEFYLLTLKDTGTRAAILEPGNSQAFQELDLIVLHRLIFQKLLDLHDEATIGFTHDETVALAEVQTGRYTGAFFLNPTTVSQVVRVATAGERLPAKATYFYPKLVSGLVFLKVNPTEILGVAKQFL